MTSLGMADPLDKEEHPMAFVLGHALLVGVGTYQNPRLSAPVTAQDAQALAAALADPATAGYPPEQVRLLSGAVASRAGVLAALGDLADQTTAQSTVLLFLCGHGVPAGDSGYYFLPANARQTAAGGWDPTTVISSAELVAAIERIPSQKTLLLLNTCFSGVVAGALDADDLGNETAPPSDAVLTALLGSGTGRVVISACRRTEKSYYNQNAAHTLFVQALLDSLAGQGSAPSRRAYLGAFELYEAVYEQVVAQAQQLRPPAVQSPVITVREGVGPFPVALVRGGTGAGGNLAPETDLKPLPTIGEVRLVPAWMAGHDAAVTSGHGTAVSGTGNVVQQGQTNVLMDQASGVTVGDHNQVHNYGAGSQVQHGDIVGGDKVGGDKVGGDKMTIGNVTNSAVAQGQGAQASNQQGLGADELVRLFAAVHQQIDARPVDPGVDKEELVQQVDAIQQEAAKGEHANESKMQRWLRALGDAAPDILDVTVATLTNPVAGVALTIRKIAERAREEAHQG